MASIRHATCYNKSGSLSSLNTPTKSDPSSSAKYSSFSSSSRALIAMKGDVATAHSSSSRALIVMKGDAATAHVNFMVKKFVETKKAKNLDMGPKAFVIASDLLAEDL